MADAEADLNEALRTTGVRVPFTAAARNLLTGAERLRAAAMLAGGGFRVTLQLTPEPEHADK